jgi:predicted small secreted protein
MTILGTPHCARSVRALYSGMKFTSKSFVLLLLGAAAVAFAGTSCNTTHGLGKDVEKLGDKIQEKSR